MIKTRIQFSKSGPLIYVGHLDLQRIFQQTIRRAKIPVVYSQGFNPHVLLSFALPLPLGMESVNDYADIVMKDQKDIVYALNLNAPDGLTIKKAYQTEGHKSAALTVAASYRFKADIPLSKAKESVAALMENKTIFVSKKTKSGIKDTDIRPDILDLKAQEDGIYMQLAAGSARFLNPLTVVSCLEMDKLASSFERLELFRKTNDESLVPL